MLKLNTKTFFNELLQKLEKLKSTISTRDWAKNGEHREFWTP